MKSPVLKRSLFMIVMGSLVTLNGCGGSTSSGNDSLANETSFLVSTQLSGGTAVVTPESANVDAGTSIEIEVDLEIGYRIESVDGCDGTLDGATYTTGPAGADCTVVITLVDFPAPSLSLAPQDGKILVSWPDVDGAAAYDLYYASESIEDIGNYASYSGANLVLDAESPYSVDNLDNGETYYFRAVAKAGPGQSLPGDEVSAVPASLTFPIGGLNDTGQDTCANNEELGLACPQTAFPNQDGDLGRDAAARAGTLAKIGAGAAGFDYTKLDGSGDELPDDASEWNCIRDNVTGLIWERKQPGSTTSRAVGKTYRWYDPDPNANAGYAGRETEIWPPVDRESTYDYINYVNGIELCGFDDWRLPRLFELRSIVHLGREAPKLDTDYFLISSTYQTLWATSQTSSSTAWTVNFQLGRSSNEQKTNYRAVMLVRGGQ